VLGTCGPLHGLPEHEADEGNHREVGKRPSVALVVFDEAAEARGPGERPFDDPAAWELGLTIARTTCSNAKPRTQPGGRAFPSSNWKTGMRA